MSGKSGTTLGKAYVQIMPSTENIGSNIFKELGGEVDAAGVNAGESLGGKLVSTLKKVVVAAGIGQFIKSAINFGGELEQNLGGTEAVFGSFAESIQNSAQDAYKNMGLSASDYMATANKMGSLFQGSGLEQQRALDLTATSMQRAADVASVMGLDTTMAMESIAGAAKGNFTMMDNLGVAMNATTIEAYALEKGINFKWETASQAEKTEIAMKMFMDRTTQYAGNFAKESTDTYAGALGAMQSSFKNILAALATGQDWGNALDGLMNSTVAFVQNLMPMLTDIFLDLPLLLVNVLSDLAPQLLAAGMQMISNVLLGWGGRLPELIPQILEAVLTIVDTLITNIPQLIEAGLQLIIGLAEGLVAAIPVLVDRIPAIIKNIVDSLLKMIPKIINTGVELLSSLVEDLPKIIVMIVEVLPQIVESVIKTLLSHLPDIIKAGVNLLTSLVSNLPQIIITVITAIPEIVLGLVSAITENIPLIVEAGVELFIAIIENLPQIIWEIVKAVPQIIDGIVEAFGSLMWKIFEIGGNIVEGLWEGIKSLAGWLWDKVTGWITSIWDGIKNFFGIKSPSKEMAWIGEMLDKGLAKGIVDNTKPIKKAMDKVGSIATKSFESEIAINAATTSFGTSTSLESGIVEKEQTAASLYAIDYGRLANAVMVAFVEAGVAVKVDNREFGRLVANYT